MLALREALVFLRGRLERIYPAYITETESLFRDFPLGNIKIFVTRFSRERYFCSGCPGGYLRD